MNKYNYIDLFHGIGGFALGAYWAGMKFKNHFCSDIEPYSQELYKLRFPDSIQLGDITKIDTEELKKYGDNWIITGGFPCQDISIAGKGEGIHGKRSGLWFEYWRIIRDLRPQFAIMENVGMLISRGLREVLGSLTEIGYNAEWQDIRASDMGAPHKRERLWIVAYSSHDRLERKPSKKINNKKNEAQKRCEIGGKYKKKNASDTNMQRFEWESNDRDNRNLVNERSTILCDDAKSEKTMLARQRKSKRYINWKLEPDVGRLANGVPDKVDRLKGLGNAIVPQIAQLLFEQIKEFMNE
jgi:DNA (cytosine-5)-methyltransferase 1